ncbi:ABC transporter ATP-binding protein [Curtanaerobium respiraculi]|uniref:ABC transporter ATP-binding protein n=1 Tax=Curtanaerobium respiraculi TaxID=2949669 RepID=UPI0024B3AF65|nr:ABC transporter ATP-binding protein [Curtanaerobium respiraculi]
MSEELLRIRHLNVGFLVKNEVLEIIHDLSLDIHPHEIVAVVGETGCGKSVTGNAVLNILPDNAIVSGSISYRGRQLAGMGEREFQALRGSEIMCIPQSPSTSLDPLMKAGRQVEECVEVRAAREFGGTAGAGKGVKKKLRAQTESTVRALFQRLRLTPAEARMNNYPCELSGGMCQRVLIAMGAATHPELLIVDEPTKAIDWALRIEVAHMLAQLRDEAGCAMMLITHDIPLASAVADRVAVMYAGQIIEMGPTEQIFGDAAHPYTRGLIDSMPTHGFKPMRGYMPAFTDLPPGCRFSDRCPYVSDVCTKMDIELMPVDVESSERVARAHEMAEQVGDRPGPDRRGRTHGTRVDHADLGHVHSCRCFFSADELCEGKA